MKRLLICMALLFAIFVSSPAKIKRVETHRDRSLDRIHRDISTADSYEKIFALLEQEYLLHRSCY